MNKNDQLREAITKAVQNGRNVLLEGPHGIGKTTLALAVAAKLDLRLKYLSASTLDPFADLIGIPVPITDEDGVRRIVYLRPDAINQAQIIFFDELNRAHPKVLNAVFELVQFHSINGDKLPRLQSVIAVINPVGNGYQVQELDPALTDRFHIHLRLTIGADRHWFVNRYGSDLGHALVNWFETDLDDQQRAQISNRRLEYIGLCWKDGIQLQHALPLDVQAPLHLLESRLRNEEGVLTAEQFVHEPNKFAEQVTTNLDVALRFAKVLPTMNPQQKRCVIDIVLALPAEVLAMLKSEFPFVFKKVRAAIASGKGQAEAEAFWDLLQERLCEIK